MVLSFLEHQHQFTTQSKDNMQGLMWIAKLLVLSSVYTLGECIVLQPIAPSRPARQQTKQAVKTLDPPPPPTLNLFDIMLVLETEAQRPSFNPPLLERKQINHIVPNDYPLHPFYWQDEFITFPLMYGQVPMSIGHSTFPIEEMIDFDGPLFEDPAKDNWISEVMRPLILELGLD